MLFLLLIDLRLIGFFVEIFAIKKSFWHILLLGKAFFKHSKFNIETFLIQKWAGVKEMQALTIVLCHDSICVPHA